MLLALLTLNTVLTVAGAQPGAGCCWCCKLWLLGLGAWCRCICCWLPVHCYRSDSLLSHVLSASHSQGLALLLAAEALCGEGWHIPPWHHLPLCRTVAAPWVEVPLQMQP